MQQQHGKFNSNHNNSDDNNEIGKATTKRATNATATMSNKELENLTTTCEKRLK